MDEVSVELRAWTAFHTPNLCIEPSLLAAKHTFDFESRAVTLALPDAPRANRDDGDVISFNTWRVVDGQKQPLQYNVGEVQFLVSIPGSHRLPAPMMDRPPNAFDIVDDTLQRRLGELASAHYGIALRAFERWARTLRWKTGLWNIARGRVESLATGWGSTLQDASTGKRLWTHHEACEVEAEPRVTVDQWTSAGDALRAGEEPPVFVDLFLDAQMHLASSDVRRAIVDGAVAAETYIRSTVQSTLPPDLGIRARELLDESNIRPVMTKVFPESLERLGKVTVVKDAMADIHQLLDARNKLLHTGLPSGVDIEKCAKYLRAVQLLLSR